MKQVTITKDNFDRYLLIDQQIAAKKSGEVADLDDFVYCADDLVLLVAFRGCRWPAGNDQYVEVNNKIWLIDDIMCGVAIEINQDKHQLLQLFDQF